MTLLLVVAVGAWIWYTRLAPSGIPSGERERVAVNSLPAAVNSVENQAVKDYKLLPGGETSPVVSGDINSRYMHALKCTRYFRLKAAVTRQVADPNSWINDDEAAGRLDPDQLNVLQKNEETVRTLSKECSQRISAEETYSAALEAAIAGNREAARCYVLAPWGEIGDGITDLVKDNYVANAEQLADRSVKAGDWGMINLLLAVHAAPSRGLSAAVFPADYRRAYGLAHLKELGAATSSDPVFANRVSNDATILQAKLTASEVFEQRQWADRTYKAYFRTKGPSSDVPPCDY